MRHFCGGESKMGSCGDCPPIPSSQVGVPVRDILRFLSAGHVSSRVASQQMEIGKFLFLFAPDFRVGNPGIWHIFLECHFRSSTHVAPRHFEFGYTPAIGVPADHRRIWGYHDDPCLTMRIQTRQWDKCFFVRAVRMRPRVHRVVPILFSVGNVSLSRLLSVSVARTSRLQNSPRLDNGASRTRTLERI